MLDMQHKKKTIELKKKISKRLINKNFNCYKSKIPTWRYFTIYLQNAIR